MASAPLDPAVLPLLLSVAVALAMLLVILAITVTIGLGRLGRLGIDQAAAGERHRDSAASSPPPTDRRSRDDPAAPARSGAADRSLSDPWREAGRRLQTVAGSS